MGNSFKDLPDEIKIKIFSHFFLHELARTIAPVCRDWFRLSLDPCLWKRVTLNLSGDPTKCVKKNIRLLIRCTHLDHLAMFSYDSSGVPKCLFKLLSAPTLRSLDFNGMTLEKEDMKKIVRKYPLIEKLCFNFCSKMFTTVELITFCATLTHLRELEISQATTDFGDSCIEMLSKNCRKLQSLIVNRADITGAGIKVLAEYSHETLQELELLSERNDNWFDSYVPLGTCKKLVSIKITCSNVISKATLEAFSALPSLKTLHLNGSSGLPYLGTDRNVTLEEKEQMEEGFAVFLSSPFRSKLKELTIYSMSIGEVALINMSVNCSKLQELVLNGCTGITDKGLQEVVDKCTVLKHLRIFCCFPVTGVFMIIPPSRWKATVFT